MDLASVNDEQLNARIIYHKDAGKAKEHLKAAVTAVQCMIRMNGSKNLFKSLSAQADKEAERLGMDVPINTNIEAMSHKVNSHLDAVASATAATEAAQNMPDNGAEDLRDSKVRRGSTNLV